MGVNAGTTAICVAISFTLTTLLGLGAFGSHWIAGAGCVELNFQTECCKQYRNTYHRCGHDFALADVSTDVNALVLVAFAVCLVIFIPFFCGGWCWCSDFQFSDFRHCYPASWHRGCGTLGGYLLWLTPVAAALSFSGCMMILDDFKDAPLSWGFYVCLVGSCLLVIATIALIIYVCRRRSSYLSELQLKKYGRAGMEAGSGSCSTSCMMSINAVLLAGDISETEENIEL